MARISYRRTERAKKGAAAVPASHTVTAPAEIGKIIAASGRNGIEARIKFADDAERYDARMAAYKIAERQLSAARAREAKRR